MVYQIMANHTEAMGWFKKAIDAELPYGNTPRMAVRYNNLGNSYMALKIRDQAKVNFEKTYEIFLAAGYLPQLSKVSGSLGQLYVNMGIPEKAESWLIKAKNYAEQAGTLPEQMISYRHLYEFYKSQGKYENSLNFYELFTQANDSIFNLNVSKQVEEMEAKYQNQQKQLEIDRLETENVFTLKEVAFKKRQRNFALFGVAFLLLVTLSLYYLLALLKKQKKQVDAQNAELDRLNKTLNRLFAILSHDLRNATASYQSLVKVIGHHLQKGSTEKLIPISAEMETNARNLSAMLEGLLQWSVTQLKGIVPKKENISLRKTVEKEVALVFADAQNKGNTITIDIDNDERLWCDPESFSIVVRNLLVNANKFTDQGIINVSSEQNDGMIRIAVSDTGCGMPASIANSLFTGDEGTIRTGTSGEKGTGLGLMLVKEHIEKNRGTIRVESEEGKGTKFILQFPSEQV